MREKAKSPDVFSIGAHQKEAGAEEKIYMTGVGSHSGMGGGATALRGLWRRGRWLWLQSGSIGRGLLDTTRREAVRRRRCLTRPPSRSCEAAIPGCLARSRQIPERANASDRIHVLRPVLILCPHCRLGDALFNGCNVRPAGYDVGP